MSSISYSAFLPYVLPYASHVLEDQAVAAIRNACIDFCAGSLLLQEDLDPQDVVAGQSVYSVEGSGQTCQVLSMYYLGRRLERKSELELQRLYTRDWQSLVGAPRYWTQFNLDEVVLALKPAEDRPAALTGRIAYRPKRSSTTVDARLFEQYLDAVAAGALSRLLVTPEQPYTDPRMAREYEQRFQAATSQARSFVNGGMNHAPMRVRFNRIW